MQQVKKVKYREIHCTCVNGDTGTCNKKCLLLHDGRTSYICKELDAGDTLTIYKPEVRK